MLTLSDLDQSTQLFHSKYYEIIHKIIFSNRVKTIVTALTLGMSIFGYLHTQLLAMIPAQLVILLSYFILDFFWTKNLRKAFQIGITIFPFVATLSWIWQMQLYFVADNSMLVTNTPILLIAIWLFSYSYRTYWIPIYAGLCSLCFLISLNMIWSKAVQDEYYPSYFTSYMFGYLVNYLIQWILRREFNLSSQNEKIKLSESERKAMLENIPLGILSLVKVRDRLVIEKSYSKYLPSTLNVPSVSGLSLDRFLVLIGLNAGQSQILIESLHACLEEDEIAWELNSAHFPLSSTFRSKEGNQSFYRLTWTPQLVDTIVLKVLVTISDETTLEDAKLSSQRNEVKITIVSELLPLNSRSVSTLFADIERLLVLISQSSSEFNMRRYIRPIKGAARQLGLRSLATSLHQLEDCIEKPILFGNALQELQSLFQQYRTVNDDYFSMKHTEGTILVNEIDLRKAILHTESSSIKRYIMKPALNFFADLTSIREVLSASQLRSKKVSLTLVEESGPHFIDIRHLSFFDKLFSLLISNSVDHGIERPEDRLKLGKVETGVLTIIVQNSGFTFFDDGAGLDAESIRGKSKALSDINRPSLSTKEIAQLIF
ncbi:MAG: hypothetical protein EOP04_09080 [Proteobacteria bacterium]|nr:MAG: hypothetical protein EOP04_09080 [Pseudomonadota bacterium]